MSKIRSVRLGCVSGLAIGLSVGAALGGPAPTSTYTVNLSHAVANGLKGDSLNTRFEDLFVTNLLYYELFAYSSDITIDTFGLTFFSEIGLGFSDDLTGWNNTVFPATGVDGFGVMRFTSDGVIGWDSALGRELGPIDIEVFSTFSGLGGKEARQLEGSTFTFHTRIPTPGTAGVLCLGGLIATRRRR